MKILGNIIWIVFGGLLLSLEYIVAGILMCVTIIGIPFGVQAFKLGFLALCPFGHKAADAPGEPGCLSVVMNIIWILVGGIWIALTHLVFGILFCVVRVAAFQIDDALVYSFRQGHSQLLAMP